MQEPSSLLAAIVNIVRQSWVALNIPGDRASFLGIVRNMILVSGTAPAGYSRQELYARKHVADAAAWIDTRYLARSHAEFADLITAIQLLDQWHAPICNDLSGMQHSFSDLDLLDAQLRLDSDGAFNSDRTKGLLVPRYGADWRLCPTDWIERQIRKQYTEAFDDTAHFDLRPHMLNTCLLPPMIRVSAANAGRGTPRHVPMRYHVPNISTLPPIGAQCHRIMITPLLENEAHIALSENAGRYRVNTVDRSQIVPTIVAKAYEEQGTVLFAPEMAFNGDAFESLRIELADAHAKFSSKFRRSPPLAYTIVGVLEAGQPDDENYVAVLGPTGALLAKQPKITRWDLGKDEQCMLGLGTDPNTRPDYLEEAIGPAGEVELIELPGLGRLLILICADMDVDEPGDFLYVNGGLDWVYAPIMDRSRTPRRDGGREDWIVDRAVRAATATKACVVVTNSIPLTAISNRTNAVRKLPFPSQSECHVALLIEGGEIGTPTKEEKVGLNANSVLVVSDWMDGWTPFMRGQNKK